LRERIAAEDVAAAPQWEGRVQPLCALYRKNACRLFEIVLRTGEASPTRALAALPCTLLSEADVREADPEGKSFINLNTEEGLAAMSRRAGASPRGR
jgi:molybdopterin-guanine dinucleotide biosynthesis protein A